MIEGLVLVQLAPSLGSAPVLSLTLVSYCLVVPGLFESLAPSCAQPAPSMRSESLLLYVYNILLPFKVLCQLLAVVVGV